MSSAAQKLSAMTNHPEKRFYPRISPRIPIFLTMDGTNLNRLINLSENGLLLSIPKAVAPNFVTRISIYLDGLPKSIEVIARVVWTNEEGKFAGIQLLDLSDRHREQIRGWGAQELTKQSLPSNPNPSLPAVMPLPAPEQRTSVKSPIRETVLLVKARSIAPAISTPVKTARTVSDFTISVMVAMTLLLGTACVAGALILNNPVRGNASTSSTASRDLRSAGSAADQNGRSDQKQTDEMKPDSTVGIVASQPGTRIGKPNHLIGSDSPDSSSNRNEDDANENEEAGGLAADSSRSKIEAGSSGEIKNGQQNEPEVSTTANDNSVKMQSAPSNNNIGATSSPAPEAIPETRSAPGYPNFARLSAPSSADPARTTIFATPARPAFGSVIQMDVPPAKVLQIHLPRGYRAPIYNLPEERIIQSPSATIRIQRSVHLPMSHWGAPVNRNLKLTMGALTSRVEPQIASMRLSRTDFVRVQALVSEDGHVESVRPLQGSPGLEMAVANALREWRYQPTLLNGKPVQTESYVEVYFHGSVTHAAK
jgi:hypothetical protein